MPVKRIVSGGQTGADQTGLEVAKELGLETGGTAPKGYRTETGPNLALRDIYGLKESIHWNYSYRTYVNVMDADGTVIFGDRNSAGSKQTIGDCSANGKRFLINPTSERLREWIEEKNIQTLNVAGNRLSKNPGVVKLVRDTLMEALKSE